MTTAEQILAAADFAGQENPSSTAVNGEFPYSAIKGKTASTVQSSSRDDKSTGYVLHAVENAILTSPALCPWCTAKCLPTFSCALPVRHREPPLPGRGTSHTDVLPLWRSTVERKSYRGPDSCFIDQL